MKKECILIILSAHIPTQPSDREKTFISEESDTTQSLTPYSPSDTTALSLPAVLPSTSSIDSFTAQMDESKNIFEALQHDLQVAQYRHQKLIQRLQQNKKNFFTAQEAERESTTFSRWEKFKKKPQAFEEEQKNAIKNFLTAIEEQLEESQAYERECLQKLQKDPLSRSTNKSPLKIKQKQQIDFEEMVSRHSQEKRSIREIPEPSAREKLLKLWDNK